MIRQSTQDQSQTTTPSSPSSSNPPWSALRRYVFRRWCLGVLAVVMIVLIVFGILFAAHAYYHAMGGQGFLRAKRWDLGSGQHDGTEVYLPLREVETLGMESSTWALFGRSPKNIPFYTCGDQQNSCETFAHPNICCPVTMTCYPAKFTPSGIFCCNNTDYSHEFKCEPSEDNPPKCMASTVQCSEATGGGCCPSTSECSPNGCIHISSPSMISASPTNATSSDLRSASPTSSVTRNSVIITGTPITVTSTVTQRPEATQTLAKSGEVLEAKGVKGSIVKTLCVPYSTACLLVGVAALMGLL